jgi:hypothetical protein
VGALSPAVEQLVCEADCLYIGRGLKMSRMRPSLPCIPSWHVKEQLYLYLYSYKFVFAFSDINIQSECVVVMEFEFLDTVLERILLKYFFL